MTPALKKNSGVKNRPKNSKEGNLSRREFQEAYFTHILSSLSFLFFPLTKKRSWKNAEHQKLIKTCKPNLSKRSPHNSQNDHQQNSPQTINAEGVLEDCGPSSCWWGVNW